jgi:hypothetical protein
MKLVSKIKILLSICLLIIVIIFIIIPIVYKDKEPFLNYSFNLENIEGKKLNNEPDKEYLRSS